MKIKKKGEGRKERKRREDKKKETRTAIL